MRAYILRAIIKRDLKETFRNPQTLIIVGITVGINIFMSFAISRPLWVMTFSMSLVMIGFTLTSFIVTEEKDKRTLEALLVSPASYNEILIGKVFLTFSLTVLISLALIFSLHFSEVSIIHTLLSVPIGALIICLFGMVVGLICPSVAALSGIGTILMLTLFLPEILASTNDYVGYVARALPTHHVIQISSLGKDGFSSTVLMHYAVLVLSLIVTIFWVQSFIKTSSKQESRSWKFDWSNKIHTLLLLFVLFLSSLLFLPYRSEVIMENGISKYFNAKYLISMPINEKEFEIREFSFQNKFVAMFKMRSSLDDHIFLTIKKRNKDQQEQDGVKQLLDDLGKENVLNPKVERINTINGLVASKITYETKRGHVLYYLFSSDKFSYQLGVKISENSPNHKYLSDLLDGYFNAIQLL